MKNNGVCPVSSADVDVVPESYHQINRCICFLCTCGEHKCPSMSKSVYNKNVFSSSYKRSYSRPTVRSVTYRVTSKYKESSSKMDMKTTYMNEFTNKPLETQASKRAKTPQPSFEFNGNTQYSRDFPNWGPVFVVHNKRPVHPVHDTKIKFRARSSYEADFKDLGNVNEVLSKRKSEDKIKGLFCGPIESTSHCQFRKADEIYLGRYCKRVAEPYVPTAYNPHQFCTTFKAAFVAENIPLRDPVRMRREALIKSKNN